jgi:hypothetical protein
MLGSSSQVCMSLNENHFGSDRHEINGDIGQIRARDPRQKTGVGLPVFTSYLEVRHITAISETTRPSEIRWRLLFIQNP